MSAAAPVRVAIVIDPALAPGLLANTVATLSIGLGAALPVLGGTPLTDAAGRRILCSAKRPVPVLEAHGERIRDLLLRAIPTPDGAVVVPFPSFARSLHEFSDYETAFPERDLSAESINGVGLAGPERWVRSLTGSLRLLR